MCRWARIFVFLVGGLLVSTPFATADVKDFQQPNAYAVVIGISQYREEVIPKVAYAVKDAEAVAQLLEKQAGIPKTHIRILTDAKATGNDLRTVGDWLRMRVKSESKVYVYYAGHGTPNPTTGEAYLVPWDGNPDYPTGLFPLNELYSTLNKLPAKDIVVLLDSCFSGAQGRSVLAKGARPMVISVENPLLANGKVIVLAAATGSQISSDYDKAGHGLFTYVLLTGLQGEADTDKNGLVTLKELYPYVRRQVTETAVEELNREQTPVLLPGDEYLGDRSSRPLAQVILGFKPTVLRTIQPRADAPKPIQEARARPYEAPRQTGREIVGKDGAPMALVPEGEFLYGDDKRRVTLKAFYMDKYEVTVSRYAKFLKNTASEAPKYWEKSMPVNFGDRPVTGVDWTDASTYCKWAGKRLPAEQEWEKAARGTDGRTYPWGEDTPTRLHANFGKSKWQDYATLVPVGKLEDGKSPYGIYDMAGNVWEWTSSDSLNRANPSLREFLEKAGPDNPGASTEDLTAYWQVHYGSPNRKVLRGGSWSSNANAVRSSNRENLIPESREYISGFRCVQDASR